jgi:asparagine synthase (glutamine-hydrolysing)
MCGIAGFIADHDDKSLDSELLGRMLSRLRHRGPDDVGVRVDQRVGLGHARLSIIDLAGGAQPMTNEDGNLWIVFNGEIFNYLELRQELQAKGHRFATRSDTEVILHLFEDLGENCVSRLNGQWAFAIWDARRRRLFLSRDRFGVRPLFYAFAADSFVFASEIKALLQYRGIEPELDIRALDEIFTFWYTLPPRTAFRGVFELPPGHSATVTDGRLAVKPYWDLDYSDPDPVCRGESAQEQQYGEELLALLADATRLRLRSDVPVGAYLSGGLDSTLIAALVNRSGVSRLSTFSVCFEDGEMDESRFQTDAVQHLGTEHHKILCSCDQIGKTFPDVVWHTEKPVLRTAPVPLFLLSKLVHDSGFKVVLTGEGSDELLGGYDIYKEVKIRAFWAHRPSSRLRPLLLRRLYPYMPQIQSQPLAYLQAFFHIDSADVRSPFFSHLPRWRLTSKLKSFFSDDIRSALNGYDPLHSLDGLLPQSYRGWDPFTRAQYIEARHLLPGYILSSQGDRVAMAHSVEGRFPFLDHRIAEFASRLPACLKMGALQEKFLLKRLASPLVPQAIIHRPKQPYRAPDARSFFSGSSSGYFEELLSPDRIRREGVFNPVAVQKLVQKSRAGRAVSVGDNMAVVGVISTHLLMEKFGARFVG